LDKDKHLHSSSYL